jgi:hypothetical protein
MYGWVGGYAYHLIGSKYLLRLLQNDSSELAPSGSPTHQEGLPSLRSTARIERAPPP